MSLDKHSVSIDRTKRSAWAFRFGLRGGTRIDRPRWTEAGCERTSRTWRRDRAKRNEWDAKERQLRRRRCEPSGPSFLGSMPGEGSKRNPPCFQMHQEEDIVGDEATTRPVAGTLHM